MSNLIFLVFMRLNSVLSPISIQYRGFYILWVKMRQTIYHYTSEKICSWRKALNFVILSHVQTQPEMNTWSVILFSNVCHICFFSPQIKTLVSFSPLFADLIVCFDKNVPTVTIYFLLKPFHSFLLTYKTVASTNSSLFVFISDKYYLKFIYVFRSKVRK